jgi:hypothetical protein
MSLIQNIDGVPAYTTIQEALAYGAQFGVANYHTHIINGSVAYMAGSTHDEVTSSIRLNVAPIQTTNPSSGGSSGGGGGY